MGNEGFFDSFEIHGGNEVNSTPEENILSAPGTPPSCTWGALIRCAINNSFEIFSAQLAFLSTQNLSLLHLAPITYPRSPAENLKHIPRVTHFSANQRSKCTSIPPRIHETIFKSVKYINRLLQKIHFETSPPKQFCTKTEIKNQSPITPETDVNP